MKKLNRAKSLENDLVITLGKLAQTTESASHHKFRSEAIIDSMDEAIVVFGKENEVIFINKKAINIFSIQHKKYIGIDSYQMWELLKNNCQLSIKQQKEEQLKKITSTNSNLLTLNFDVHIKSPADLHLKCFTGPIHDDKYGYLGRIWKFEDQTERVKLEQVKSEFISIASHQLRTPITSISGYLSMVEDGDFGEVPENLREPLDAVTKASKQLRELVNDLLNTSRLEAKKVMPEIVEFELVTLIQDEIAAQREQANEKLISIKLTASESFEIKSDPKMIREAIKNYLSNAIKYSRENGIITVSIEELDKELKVCVADQGIGIPEDAQKHLFEKMFRADNVLKENFEGTGLGLYYVKQMISSLKGNVGFESTEDEGSKFFIILPKA